MTPRLSVLLPVYNGEAYLCAALQSVLDQTFQDFELLVLNDGSTDQSASRIKKFTDPRIRYIETPNQGLRATLNLGIKESRGEFIARMDHDDISLASRFQKQIDFLDSHPDHIVVGTTFAYMDGSGAITGVFPALLHNEDIQREILTQSPFGHGSVMIRAKTLRDGGFLYALDAMHIEDYELWLRLSKVGKMANLPNILYYWRHFPQNTSHKNFSLQRKKTQELQDKAFFEGRCAHVLSWSGFQSLRRYKNEAVMIEGKTASLARRDAASLLYINLARLFARHKSYLHAVHASVFAFLIRPLYIIALLTRRVFHRRENLYYQ